MTEQSLLQTQLGNVIVDNGFTPPDNTFDNTQGYKVGMFYVARAADLAYMCVSNTTNFAIWVLLGPAPDETRTANFSVTAIGATAFVDSDSDVTCTLADDSGVSQFRVGDFAYVGIENTGVGPGRVVFNPGSGVTIKYLDKVYVNPDVIFELVRDQGSIVTVKKIAAETYRLYGDVTYS